MSLSSVKCKKNPDHTQFIPIKNLNRDHLPHPFNHVDWVSYIRLLAHDTVRLNVSSTSAARAENFGFKEYIDTNQVRLGNGTAFLMAMGSPQPCPFQNCQENHEKGHLTSGVFKVVTAAHVVFDTSEALNTKIDFFFDGDDEESTNSIVRAQGIRVSSVDIERNRSVVECVTHDLTLFDRLLSYQKQRAELLTRLQEMMKWHSQSTASTISRARGEKNMLESAENSANNKECHENLAVVVSHPHGCSKHVSVGRMLNLEREGSVRSLPGGNQKLMGCTMNYTTATCRGSGGGGVHVFDDEHVYLAFAPHSAAQGDQNNLSGLGWTVNVK